MQYLWFLALVSSICLEGLGRKYLPVVPSAVFYFLKDVVLLFGYYRFRPPAQVRAAAAWLYRGFAIFWIIGLGWTAIEIFNPEQGSFVLGLIGFRAYWLWWLAPPIIATVLQNQKEKRRAIYVLLIMATAIAGLAVVQFASPPTSAVNLYSVVDGEEIYADMAVISTTGRPRVASTFSFLSGFHDFAILVPTILFSLGLEATDRSMRRFALTATFFSAAVMPMSGSRATVLLGAAILLITLWTSGMFFTRVGRRVLIGGIAATVLALFAFPDAILGVSDRFANQEETNTRYLGVMETLFPPLALADMRYPVMGIGTGMQQNVRLSMHVDSPAWGEELEPGRYLVELGPVGFLAVWTSKLGLIVALLRAYKILKRAGRRGAAAAALSYAVLTMNGNLTFDHIWQALYFMGCGFILAEVVSVLRERVAVREAQPEPVPQVAAIAR